MIRDIAVYLNGSQQDRGRIEYASELARVFDAHLTGLAENLLIEMPVAFDGVTAVAIPETVIEEADARSRKRMKELTGALEKTGLRHELRRVDAYLGGMPAAMSRMVRLSDLFVGTLPLNGSSGLRDVVEAVMFGSGRGCFLVPPDGEPRKTYDRVLVAWKDTRESARALSEGLPFLHRAKEVTVAIVEEGGAGEQMGEDVGADVGRYLSRHNLKVEIRKINGWESVSDALLNEAKNVQADLIVLGGYGHSRFREWALGGVTDDLLTSATIPLLMAH
jgi:nucleotide-binding universal stress UspA family protein